MEVVDGRLWDTIMRERLFEPVGLTGTSSRREDVDRERAAMGHLARSLEEAPIVSPMRRAPTAPAESGARPCSAHSIHGRLPPAGAN
jgi:CubicO group peptidase (beta-lactamase class C family)